MKKVLDTVTNTVRFTFDGLEPVVLHVAKVSPANAAYATLHGFGARVGDNAALPMKQANGTVKKVTEADRRAAVVELVTYYESGATEWNTRSSGVPRSLNPTWLALAEKRGVAYDVVAAEKAAADLAELEAM